MSKKLIDPLSESGQKLSPEKTAWSKLKFSFKPKNTWQKDYCNIIGENQITICVGKSGVGKSLCALGEAINQLRNPETLYKKLVLMVAPVQTDIEVGFLKGGLEDKLDPFAYSYLYNLADMIKGGINTVNELRKSGLIEIICVSFARGINLKECVCICGECQQYSKESFLTILTRLNDSSKLIMEGDILQTDNKLIRKGKEDSGLKYALDKLQGLEGIGIMDFANAEVVRNPLISKILHRWDPDNYEDI